VKRKILWMLVSFLLVAALVLASCGEAVPGEQEEEEEEEEEVPVAGEPQYGGTLTHYMGWGCEATSADTCDAMWPTPMFTTPVLEFLIQGDFEKYGPRGTDEFPFTLERDIPEQFCKGTLAESWEVTADKLTFHIRPGVIWAAYGKEDVMEPRELTAEDVAWSLNRYFDSVGGGSGSKRTENGGWVDSVYDEGNKVIVETSSFNANWLFEVGKGVNNKIYAPEVVDAGASDWDNLVGTGPFMLKKYTTGSHLAYERNPNYWDTATINGKEYEIPFVDELIWPIIPDESTRIASLRTGKLDVWYCTPPEYTESLNKTSPELIRKSWPHCTIKYITLRCDREPTSNKEVRRALMIAVDREAVMEAVFKEGDIWSWPVNPGVAGVYTPIDELPPEAQELFEYDPDKARQMIIDAGYTNGITGLEICAITRESDYVDMATMVAAYWTKIGVETTVRPMETSAHTAYVRSGEADCTTGCATNANQLITFRDKFLPGELGNRSYYDNPYFTAQLQEAEKTVDTAERNAILKELAVIALDDVPYIPIAVEAFNATWWPWVKNYYGEWEASSYGPGPIAARVWIDQVMKAEMGYK